MERKITSFLEKWKKELIRKPLCIYGAKQIGKTFTILEFGKKEYKNTIYFNTDNNDELLDVFKKEKATDKIIMKLSLLSGETILKNDTLIVFDSVNAVEIVKSLNLFGSQKSEYHIILITSRRENLTKFRSEDINFKGMFEMDFEEFLWAHKEKPLAELIKESFLKRKKCPFHKVALDLFYEYLTTGGMPEVILAGLNGNDVNKIDAIKQKIIDTYQKEIAVNSTLIDISRGLEVFNAIAKQLQKENKKFQYGLIGYGKRAKEYEGTIKYLVDNQLINRSYKVNDIKSPLSSCRDTDSFKLYYNDDGVLYSMLHLNYKKFITDESLKETIYENHIAKTLVEAGYSLYYYQSQGKALVNFVIQNRMGQIIPIEITTRSMSKAKSLAVFMKKYTTLQAYRITENNFSNKKEIRYLPIYATFCLKDVKK